MRYMLDTNICIYVIRQRPSHVLKAFMEHAPLGLGISSITAAELWFGVEKTGSERNRKALKQFLEPLEIAPFDEKASKAYGSVRAELENGGTPIGPLDTQIAAHAIALKAILVSNNTREFARVSGLRLANWAEPMGAET
jgi:tRNA(fMet)-specific endonuclease VapC